jgi:hypothetical protein
VTGLSAGDLSLIIGALEDAAAYRRQAGDWCDDCRKEPEGQECAGHDSDGATARAYDELAERLQDARVGPLYFDLTVSFSKSISVFHASIGEQARLARLAGDAAADAHWSGLLAALMIPLESGARH